MGKISGDFEVSAPAEAGLAQARGGAFEITFDGYDVLFWTRYLSPVETRRLWHEVRAPRR